MHRSGDSQRQGGYIKRLDSLMAQLRGGSVVQLWGATCLVLLDVNHHYLCQVVGYPTICPWPRDPDTRVP
ncbi:hypothetical protein J6590_047624 [Homalodisca vitripennis]|nr:hypothetical protein J6590_047624 [Homalodisca vitripennis]